MSDKHFTHLHLHTDYSLLDGAITIDKLIHYGKQHKCRSLAISDHGNIFGAVKFFEKCKKANIKPILGMEAYITQSINIKKNDDRYYHLLLLVENEEGYKNLCKLIAASYSKGFYFKPRIDYELLQMHHRGLIATSTCLGGHIPQLLLQDKMNDAKTLLNQMHDLFQDRFFLEVQPGIIKEQQILNDHIFTLEKEFNIPIIATGDCHYSTREDRYAHEVMLAIQTRTTMSDPKRMTFGECQAHMQTPEEMLSVFSHREEIVWRTGEIADRCNFSFQTGKLFFPKFEIPKDFIDNKQYFEQLCKEGLQKLFNDNRIDIHKKDIYDARLQFEIDMINKMGFADYFLIVSDFIQWAKNNGIAVGPGRGSVAGALVAWAISITDIDPIKYNLLFERFLNPERISMPDIDIDFCINGRERVIDYVRTKYGHDKVGQIITFGTMMAKGSLKDVARALGFSFEDANMITDLIPDELKITIKDALEATPRLQEMCSQDRRIQELFDVALRLEGTTRHASKHAAGIVISPEPIADVLPIYIPPRTTEIVTQYAMTELELLGFLKMDFLGLKNLTLITDVINLIKKNQNIDLDITRIPLDDTETFELLSRGETSGIFQFESDGIKEVMRKLVPTCFEDLIAVNALYRPGPLGSGMVDDFIERKHGRAEIVYLFPELEPVLKDTYGVIVYQEQVMKITTAIAGYSLGESDILRRAMGKKKADVMAEQKSIFVKKAVERNFNEKKADELFELMAYFAGYGFNKSHSAAYALIAYQTAFLKTHFFKEFMSCLITLDLGSQENASIYIHEVKKRDNTKVLPPHINFSEGVFLPEGNDIRFGLLGIKSFGNAALDSIIKARNERKFKNILDLCCRIDLRVCNKRILEHLIYSGALDDMEYSRETMILNLDTIITIAQNYQEQNSSGQLGLFDVYKDEKNDNKNDSEGYLPEINLKNTSEESGNVMQRLEKEKEVLGLYISNHPLDSFDEQYEIYGAIKLAKIATYTLRQWVSRGIITQSKEIMTKKGDAMAFITVEDQNELAELIFFPQTYEKYKGIISSVNAIIFGGALSEQSGKKLKIKVDWIAPLDDTFSINSIRNWHLFINDDNKDNIIQCIKNIINQSSEGNHEMIIHFMHGDMLYEHKINKKIDLKLLPHLINTTNSLTLITGFEIIKN